MNRDIGVNDLLVLTGDNHSFWTKPLFDDQAQTMGIELNTASITSPGDFEGYIETVKKWHGRIFG